MKTKIKKFKNFLQCKRLLNKLSIFKDNNEDAVISEPECIKESLTFNYIQGITYRNMYMRMHEATYGDSKIFKQVNTKRDKYGIPKGKPITFYFIEGHDKEYSNLKTLTDLIDKGVLK